MKTLTATAALTVMFLSAGAFAGSGNVSPPVLAGHKTNVTVITKNQAWPVRRQIAVIACDISRCIDI